MRLSAPTCSAIASRFFCVILSCMMWVHPVSADRQEDLLLQARVFIYRPQVFADLPFGPLPRDPHVPISGLWYLRIAASTLSLYGWPNFKNFLWEHRIPGLDFTNDRNLSDQPLEQLFRRDLLRENDAMRHGGAYHFRFLRLGGTIVDDRIMSTLGQLRDLEVLELSDRITDRGMDWIPSLIHLKHFSAGRSKITDKSMSGLSRLNQLSRLDLRGTLVTSTGLKSVVQLPLIDLRLGPAIEDTDMDAVGQITTVGQLDISESHVSGKGLAAVAKLSGLHTLFLGASITDDGIQALSGLTTLRRLDMTGAKITDAGAAEVAKLKDVEELALGRTGITDAALPGLAKIPHLRYLEISDTNVTPQGLSGLAGSNSLQVLSISAHTLVRPENLLPLVRNPQLRTVIINGIPLSKDLIALLRTKAGGHSRLLDWMIPWAEAEAVSDKDLSNALEVASLSPNKTPHFEGIHAEGLERIHTAEAELGDVIAAPSNIGDTIQDDTDKNFLGEFTVQSAPSKKSK